MEDFLLVVILIVLLVRWIILSGKMSSMEERIDDASRTRTDPDLVRRVFALETAVQELRATTRPVPSPTPVTAPLWPLEARRIPTSACRPSWNYGPTPCAMQTRLE